MSSESIEKLESITKASIQQMTRWGLQPADWEVYTDEVTGEIWVNVWFEHGHSITERRKFGLYLLKSELRENSTTLPLYVNVTYDDNVTDNGIAVWWM
jgi:hypothetical protein